MGAEGRRFESGRPDQPRPAICLRSPRAGAAPWGPAAFRRTRTRHAPLRQDAGGEAHRAATTRPRAAARAFDTARASGLPTGFKKKPRARWGRCVIGEGELFQRTSGGEARPDHPNARLRPDSPLTFPTRSGATSRLSSNWVQSLPYALPWPI